MRILMVLAICLLLATPAMAEVEIKQGCMFLNTSADGDKLYIVGTPIVPDLLIDNLDIDIWASDIDRIVNFQNEFSIGLDLSYNYEIMKDTFIGVAYAGGSRNLLTHDCEFIHAPIIYGSIKF